MSDEYYYCLKHNTVEDKSGCKAADRLGPYNSKAEASRALEIAADRTEAWDNDPDWNDEPNQDKPGQNKTEPDKTEPE